MKKHVIHTQNNNLKNLKPNTRLYSVEYISEGNGTGKLNVKEFNFVKFIRNTSTELSKGLNIEGELIAEIKDIKFPKISIKTDISSGFFVEKQQALDSFMNSIENIYENVKKEYEKLKS